MKVLIIKETLYEGGVELFLLRFARALRSKGVEVEILLLSNKYYSINMISKFNDLHISSIQLPFQQVIEWIDRILFRLRLDFSFKDIYYRRVIKKKFLQGVDIVHTHYPKTDYLVSCFGAKTFKHVVTVHGDYSAQYYHHKQYGRSIWNRMDNKLDELKKEVDHWVLLSDEQIDFFKDFVKAGNERISKVYNGFDNNVTADNQKEYLIPCIAGTTFSICMAGRGVREKGWQIAINAIKKMPDDCHLFLIGDSTYLQGIKVANTEHNRIHFLGMLTDPYLFMQKCNVLLMPTLLRYEALPNVIIESLAAGTPVIATNVGEIERMITDDKTGEKAGFVIDFDTLVQYEKQVYEKLLFLYNNQGVREEMRKVAKAAFQKFNMNKCVIAYQQLYRKLLS